MSILKKKSQKQDDKKDSNQSLAVAYSVKRKQKFAKGGKVESDMDHGSRKGPEGYSKYQEQAQNEKGVHTPVSGVTQFPGGKGTSAAGDLAKDRYAGKATLTEESKKKHKEKLEEMRKMPKPKLQNLAEGGIIASTGPFKIRSEKSIRDEKQHLAEGGSILDTITDSFSEPEAPDKTNSDYHNRDLDKSKAQSFVKGFNQEESNFAEGGEVPDDDVIEHAASVAEAIMSKRKKMAEGGMVDMTETNEEEPNQMDELNEAALKENYDDQLDSLDQEEDSNTQGDSIESDRHNMISAIRRKFRSPIRG